MFAWFKKRKEKILILGNTVTGKVKFCTKPLIDKSQTAPDINNATNTDKSISSKEKEFER